MNSRKVKLNISFPKIRFECIYCGKCCINDAKGERRIVLTKREVEEISNATYVSIEGFAEENLNWTYPYIMKLVNGKCFFLEESNTCRIYSNRPLVCRFYPFVMQKIRGKYIFHEDPSCPGLGRGEYLDRKYFEKLAEEAEKRLREAR